MKRRGKLFRIIFFATTVVTFSLSVLIILPLIWLVQGRVWTMQFITALTEELKNQTKIMDDYINEQL